jgi:hypothetical protein
MLILWLTQGVDAFHVAHIKLPRGNGQFGGKKSAIGKRNRLGFFHVANVGQETKPEATPKYLAALSISFRDPPESRLSIK